MKPTIRDDSLPHQIRLFFAQRPYGQVYVTCTCLCGGGFKKGGQPIEPHGMIGFTDSFGETKELYNNPKNHKNRKVKFTEDWMI